MIRFFDIVLSFVGLVLLSPVLILITISILITDGGPVFFLQTRVGKEAKLFKIIKFRTMRRNSESAGQLTVGEKDNRITSIGKLLRRYKLDELPQLINVLVGSMSMVGPRPEVPKYVEVYSSEQKRILDVEPGITDIASLRFFRENELLSRTDNPERTYIEEIMPKKIKLNMEYVENRSLETYFKVILKTIGRIFS